MARLQRTAVHVAFRIAAATEVMLVVLLAGDPAHARNFNVIFPVARFDSATVVPARESEVHSTTSAESPWPGFETDFAPNWVGDVKQIDYHPSQGGYTGSVTGVILSTGSVGPLLTKPIQLISSDRNIDADASASVLGITASSANSGGPTYAGTWAIDADHYARVVNLQDVLLAESSAIGDQRSDVQDNGFVARGRVQSTALLQNSLVSSGDGSAGARGASSLSATYGVTQPVAFQIAGGLAGAGQVALTFSLVDESTNQPTFTFTPTPDPAGGVQTFSLSGTLVSGVYTLNVSAETTAGISAGSEPQFGGIGEYQLAFAAVPEADAASLLLPAVTWPASSGAEAVSVATPPERGAQIPEPATILLLAVAAWRVARREPSPSAK